MIKLDGNKRRASRTRYKLKQSGKLRLSVHRTPRHIYAQIIDDANGNKILAAASTVQKDLAKGLKSTGNIEAATKVGEAIAKAATAAKVKEVVFDRGSFKYHGRVKALADAARANGLEF